MRGKGEGLVGENNRERENTPPSPTLNYGQMEVYLPMALLENAIGSNVLCWRVFINFHFRPKAMEKAMFWKAGKALLLLVEADLETMRKHVKHTHTHSLTQSHFVWGKNLGTLLPISRSSFTCRNVESERCR